MPRKLEDIALRIIQEIVSRTDELTDFNTGSALRSFIDAIAAEIEETDFLREEAVASLLIQSAEGGELDKLLNGFQFYRRPGVGSITLLRFSVNNAASQDIPIPNGTIVSTDPDEIVFQSDTTAIDVLEFEVYEEGKYIAQGATSVDVYVECTTGGALTNVAANKINTVVSELPGVDVITNPSAASGGADAWSDDEYRVGFYNALKMMGRCTYQAILASAPLLADLIGEKLEFAYLAENYPEPGFNKLYVASADGEMVSEEAIAKIQKFIGLNLRGIGTSLTVSDHSKRPVPLTCVVEYEGGVLNKAIINNVLMERLINYVRGINIGGARKSPDASLGKIYHNKLIREALSVPGIANIEFSEISGDIEMGCYEKPWAEEFEITEVIS